MLTPILLFAAAGAVGVGGAAGSLLLFMRGQQEAARRLKAADVDALSHYLDSEIQLQELRKKAEEAGLDPELVERGYHDLRDGTVTLQEVLDHLKKLSS